MDREEFMLRLEAKLLDIQENEKNEAIQYYEDYFNDAGVENEEEVLNKLGNPEQVAESIKAGLSGGSGEFTETGYRSGQQEKAGNEYNQVSLRGKNQGGSYRAADDSVKADGAGKRSADGTAYGNAGNPPPQPVRTSSSASKVILIIIACILLSPIILTVAGALLGVALALLGVALAVLAALFGIWISLLAVGIALFISGLICFGVGMVKLFTVPLAGAVLLGLGFLCFGFGLLLTILMVWLSVKLVPPFCRWLAGLCRKPFERKGGAV